MKGRVKKLGWLVMADLMLVAGVVGFGQQPPGDVPPANVAGKWVIYSKSDDGKTDEKSLEPNQDGEKLTGHFKGPNQSGGIEGAISGNHMEFKTKTYNVFTFADRWMVTRCTGAGVFSFTKNG